MTQKNICAITGSHGYVGGGLKNYFAARGWEILELTRHPQPGAPAMRFQLGEEIPATALADVTAVVHCAYDFTPVRWPEIQAVNVDGTEKLFRAARAAGVKRVVCLSSISAYAGCRSLYGRAKLEIEQIAHAHGAQVIRSGLVYGHDAGGMFGKLNAQVQKSSVIPLLGDGSQIQFLVHFEDLAAFVERLARGELEISTAILTAANAQPWPFKELLREIARRQNRQIRLVPLPWRLVWLALKSAESCGLRLNFRSDSLVSLMHQNPAPDFSPNAAAGLTCREFRIEDAQI